MAMTWTFRTKEAQARIRQAQFQAVQEVFEIDIKAAAKEYSPVSDTWPSIPEARGAKRIDTGNNRRTIDTDVEQTETGVKATLFTQSGYGGYLEIGTSKMPARPYLWPAFNENIQKVRTVMRRLLRDG